MASAEQRAAEEDVAPEAGTAEAGAAEAVVRMSGQTHTIRRRHPSAITCRGQLRHRPPLVSTIEANA